MQKKSRNTVITKEPRPNKLWLIILLGIIFLGFLGINSLNPAKQKSAQLLSNGEVSPTPFPYQELTVPYLREKTYESTLGDTQTVSGNGSYTTYLTSYTSEGLKINGLLTIPTGQEPPGGWPAIVVIHGYIPPAQYATLGPQYSDYVDYLARSGFVVFKIDLRGHGDSEGEPGGGYYGSDYVMDALNARAALQKVSYVDPKKIGLWGHSMAGNIVLRSMTAKPDIPAVVIWAGAVYSYTDQRKYGINDASFSPNQFNTQRFSRRREIFEKYGSPSAESVFWSQVAPTNYLNDLQGAIGIHHATDDEVVNIGYSRDLIKLLDATAVSHEFYEYPSGGHNITGGSFNQAMERTVEFFKTHLSGK
ncbi:MAG: alpha/beta fold hydrolase [Candidatus Levybacteria bacterium]|nr:alpha/beta fold hydrolase [Candidatus Levybacteria bacterium]